MGVLIFSEEEGERSTVSNLFAFQLLGVGTACSAFIHIFTCIQIPVGKTATLALIF